LTQIFKKRSEIEIRIKDALSFIMPPDLGANLAL